MKKYNLIIVQPALGRYRKGFIERLVRINKEFKISIFCSPVDDSGVKSMDEIDKSINYVKAECISFLGLFFWQSFVLKILSMRLSKGDVFVFNGNPRFLSSLLLAFYFKLKGVDVIWWGHGRSSTSSSLGCFVRFKLMSFFRVILYTDEEVKELSQIINTPMCGLNNGLDIDAIRNSYSHSICKYDADVLNLVFIGRVTNKSQFHLLIKALLALPIEISKKYQLNVVGNVDYKQLLSKFPDINRIDIQCFGEQWDESKITEILSGCHLFVYPGSVGLSLIHAFALGLPAIVHNNKQLHMPEIGCFKNGFNGVNFEYDSFLSLSSVLIDILEDRSLLKKYSLNAYDTVTHTFNTKDMANRFFNFIRNKNE